MASTWMEIFKTGTHTSGNGVTKTYTTDDLKSIEELYNAQKDHEAPLVIGHPATDSPSYGWAKQLKLAGQKLLAFVDQVEDSVVEAVQKGTYKKVSIALYPDGLLRHVGLLGATPPAVKGLAPVTFAADKEFDEFAWATDEYRMPTVGRIFSRIRDFFIEKFGLEVTDKIIDSWDVAHLQNSIESTYIPDAPITPVLQLSPQPASITNYVPAPIYTEQEERDMDELKAKLAALEAALATQSTQFSEMQTAFATLTANNQTLVELVNAQTQATKIKNQISASETTKLAFAEVIETLAKEGKVLPAEKDGLIEEYADLLTFEETMTFADNMVKPSDKMKTRLLARPVMITKSVLFADGKKVEKVLLDAKNVPVEFASMAAMVDPVSIEIDREIREYAEKNKVTYEEAATAYATA
jgi:hypothetical protein